MSLRVKLFFGFLTLFMGYLLIGLTLAIWTDNICKSQSFEGGGVSFTLVHQGCFSHKHFMGHYIYEEYTIDGIFLR